MFWFLIVLPWLMKTYPLCSFFKKTYTTKVIDVYCRTFRKDFKCTKKDVKSIGKSTILRTWMVLEL